MTLILGTDGDTTGSVVAAWKTAADVTTALLAATGSSQGAMTATEYSKLGSLPTAHVVTSAQGALLTNADSTVNPATDKASLYTLPAGTLSADHILTLGVSGSPQSGTVVEIERRDLSAHTYTVKDNAGTTLIVFAATPSGPQGVSVTFNGTHFATPTFYYLS